MSYIWEKYRTDKKFVLAKKNFVPYTEVFNSAGETSRVNIFYRFSQIYDCLADFIVEEMGKGERQIDECANILFHLLANIDFYSGITQRECALMLIDRDIRAGKYGLEISVYERLIFPHRHKILSYLAVKREEKNRRCLFFDCLNELFEVTLYYSEFADTYFVQMWVEEDKEFGDAGNKYTAAQLYETARELFCDFWLKVEVYWNIPIGIIGEGVEIGNTMIV